MSYTIAEVMLERREERLNTLKEVREMVATRADALRKDGRNGHALNEANTILWTIDAMIAKEER